MSHKTAVRIKLEELLQDGPQTMDVLYEALIPVVAPGKALRTYQRITANHRASHGTPETEPPSEDIQIRAGAKRIIYDVVNNMAKYGDVRKEILAGGAMLITPLTGEWPSGEESSMEEPAISDEVSRAEFDELKAQVEQLRQAIGSHDHHMPLLD